MESFVLAGSQVHYLQDLFDNKSDYSEEEVSEYLNYECLEDLFGDNFLNVLNFETDTHSGEFDSEKGAMYNYPIYLTIPDGDYFGIGGYCNMDGDQFNNDVHFEKVKIDPKYYIIDYSDCWADEFDLDGFSLFTEEEKEAAEKILEHINHKEEEFYFGTNQAHYMDSEAVKKLMVLREISKVEYNSISDILDYDYGLLSPRRILEVSAEKSIDKEDDTLYDYLTPFIEKL